MSSSGINNRRFSFQSLVAGGVYIIAEAGVNHNGNAHTASQMLQAAKTMGANAVKFQLFDPQALATATAPKCDYQTQNEQAVAGENQRSMLERLALHPNHMKQLMQYCETLGMDFACSPFDAESAYALQQDLQLPYIKLGSGELDNIPLLRQLAQTRTPLLLSTGMASLEEVLATAQFLRPFYGECFTESVAFLHCTSQYPAPLGALNLKAMQAMQQGLPGHVIGYSDHSTSVDAVPAMAVGLGARIYEKHFTLDTRCMLGPDHAASIEPRAFKKMVQCIRDAEQALGNGMKVPHACEQQTRQLARKSVVLKRNVLAGTVLHREDLCTKRPATGISASRFDALIGKRVIHSLDADTVLRPEHLEQA
jgi:N,N'-diacetyllegionaminate synthase